MYAVCRRPDPARMLHSPNLCHGIAGLLQIVVRFYHATHDPVFAELATELIPHLMARFDPTAPVGFRDVSGDGLLLDNPGLLEGAAGVAMALLAATTPTEPAWDRLFLLS